MEAFSTRAAPWWKSSFMVTFAFHCNLGCTFCMVEDVLGVFDGTSLEAFRRFVASPEGRTRLAGVNRIVFSGGTHFLRARGLKRLSLSGLVIDGANLPLAAETKALFSAQSINDLVIEDGGALRKLGGLLVEGGGEAAGVARAVIGIGINVRMPPASAKAVDQPWAQLEGLSPRSLARNEIVVGLLARLLPALDRFDAQGLAPFLPRYAAFDVLSGRDVAIHEASGVRGATALGIADDGALRVRDGDGEERRVHAGDVSVRA